MKKKNILRMGVIFSIAMFLLMPMISSPVAAAFTHNSDVFNTVTDESELAPWADCPPPYTFEHEGQALASFTCSYTFNDERTGGAPYQHRATITVTPGGSSTTTWTIVAAGTSPSGTISVGPLGYSTEPGITSWNVEVLAEIRLVILGEVVEYASYGDSCTIYVTC